MRLSPAADSVWAELFYSTEYPGNYFFSSCRDFLLKEGSIERYFPVSAAEKLRPPPSLHQDTKNVWRCFMNSRLWVLFAVMLCLLFLLVPGCGGGGGGGTAGVGGGGYAPQPEGEGAVNPTPVVTASPAPEPTVGIFIPGNEIITSTQTIQTTGSTVKIATAQASQEIEVSFPPGALAKSTDIIFGYNNGSLFVSQGTASGKTIFFRGSGKIIDVLEFGQPVTITVPNPENNKMVVPYQIDEQGRLHGVSLIHYDTTNKTASFSVFQASRFTWVYEDPVQFFQNADRFDTGFIPETNGFKIQNPGSLLRNGGNCHGMISFSLFLTLK
jgi:hypothetical protein